MRHVTLQDIERFREREAIRATIEAKIAELIEQLDEMDTENEDLEPSLGAPEMSTVPLQDFGIAGIEVWPFVGGGQVRWAEGGTLDLEETELDDGELDESDNEPTMGACEHHPSVWDTRAHQTCSQDLWAAGGDSDEVEAVNEDGGDILNECHDEEPDEPNLGAGEHRNPGDQTKWAAGCLDDRELVDEDGCEEASEQHALQPLWLKTFNAPDVQEAGRAARRELRDKLWRHGPRQSRDPDTVTITSDGVAMILPVTGSVR